MTANNLTTNQPARLVGPTRRARPARTRLAGSTTDAALCRPAWSPIAGVCAAAPYFDLVHGRPVPIAHAFLFGVMKAFLNSAFSEYKVSKGPPPAYVVTYAKREEIAKLYASMATHLHGKDPPFQFIYKNKSNHYVSGLGGSRMVDVEQFVCIYGATVLADAWDNPDYYRIFMGYREFYMGAFDRDTQAAGTCKPSLGAACDRCEPAQPDSAAADARSSHHLLIKARP